MSMKVYNNIALLEIVVADGDKLTIIPEDISGIELEHFSDYDALKFYLRGTPVEYHSIKTTDAVRAENGDIYEHYIKEWSKALAYNKGLCSLEKRKDLYELEEPLTSLIDELEKES